MAPAPVIKVTRARRPNRGRGRQQTEHVRERLAITRQVRERRLEADDFELPGPIRALMMTSSA